MLFTTKDTGGASTSTNCGQSSSACAGCPKVVQTDSGISTPSGIDFSVILDKMVIYSQEQSKITEKILELEKEQDKSVAFYRSATKLNIVARVTMWLLLLVPMVQLLLCAGVVYYLGIQDKISGLINWILGGVSVFSLIEIVGVFSRATKLESRIEELEKKVDKLQDEEKK